MAELSLDQALGYARDVGVSDRELASLIRLEADRVRFTQDTGNVTLSHPELPDISVHPDTVDAYAAGGWVRKQPELEPEAASPLVDVELPEEEPAEEA
jgi:hypothetical protein